MSINSEKRSSRTFKGALVMAAVLQLIGCSAQQVQSREAGSFTNLEISGAVVVHYRHSDTTGIKIEAGGDEFDRVETKVENGTLRISSKGSFKNGAKVYVTSNRLGGLLVGGAAVFRSDGTLPADSLRLNVSGSADVKAALAAGEINLAQTGASHLVLSGTAKQLSASISGAATFKSYELDCKDVNIETTGAASAKVAGTETVKARASGASDIRVKGEPRDLTAYTSGAASVTRVKGSASVDGKEDSDTTSYNLNGRKVLVVSDGKRKERKRSSREHSFRHWAGFSLGVNGYLPPSGTLRLPASQQFMDVNYARSFNLQFNLIEHDFRIVKNYVRLVTGLGIDHHQYAFVRNTNLNPDTSFTWGVVDSGDVYNYRKNKLRCTYLQVPLLIELNTSNNASKTFHLAFGVIGEYLIGSRTKQVLTQGKNEVERTRKDSYNLSPFAAKAHVNFGYRDWTVFGEYSLTSLFQPGRGPELYPFSMGIRIIPFG